MFMRNIDEITEDYLQELIDNSVSEKKTLEYKEFLPGNSEAAKKEFLADVSSFSNASGGDLIFGIAEDREKGIPKEIEGLTIENINQEITRLENMIRDGIKPRISGIEIRSIKVLESKVVLLIKVPRSWNSPHRVTFGGHDKFYTRSTTGKYPMDVTELKTAFNLSETITERIRRFREDRISKIFANETPVLFYDNAKVVLHLIPIISFNPARRYDLSRITSHPGKLEPINHNGFTNRYNLDGFLTYSEDKEGESYSYAQLFNNGIIEAVEGKYLNPRENDGKFLICGVAYENKLIEVLPGYLSVLEEINVELPIFVFLTLIGVRGYFMFVGEKRFSLQGNSGIDRDILLLLLPEVMIENYDTAPEDVLKPCFDALWDACGFPKSPSYDKAGKRKK